MTEMMNRSNCLRTLRKAALILSAFSMAVGCNTSQPSAPTQQEQQDTATASFAIQAADITQSASDSGQGRRLSALSGPSAQAFSYVDVKTIRIDVKEKNSGNVLYVNFDLYLAPIENVWKGDLPFLPKGVALTFTARALSATGTVLFNGTVDQTFSFSNENVVVTLSPANDKQTVNLPRIRKISVPSALGSDQSGNISFAVEGTTGETLQYVITPAAGGGTFYPVSGAISLAATTGTFVSQYVSPSVTTEQEFEHTVKVTNAAGHSVSTTFKTKVKPTGSTDGVKDAVVKVLFNPVINSLSARRVQGTGNVIFEAGASDDGDPSTLAYAWNFTATSGTSFDPAPVFSGATNPATLQNYTALVQGTVELKVKDTNGGTTTLYYKLTPDQFPDNPIIEGDTTGINTLRAGAEHTCALMSNGTVRCWGRSNYGQLGYGNSFTVGATASTLPYTAGDVPVVGVVTKLAVGQNHTCALLTSGFVRCWGYNNYGQLGLNTKENVGTGEAISSYGYVNLGGIATQIATGYNHTCALLDTGKVRCWGLNSSGQLGYNHNRSIGDDEYPSVAGDVALGGTAVQLSAGGNHTCALLDTGFMRCWGANGSGQLGYGNTGNLWAPGSDVATGGKVLQMATGSDHTCALLSNGSIKCWGYNLYGQLGYNGGGNLNTPAATAMDLSGATAYRVSTGSNHTCALLSTGAARCWGLNNFGQLGYGNTNSIGDNELPALSGDIKVMTPPATLVGSGEAP